MRTKRKKSEDFQCLIIAHANVPKQLSLSKQQIHISWESFEAPLCCCCYLHLKFQLCILISSSSCKCALCTKLSWNYANLRRLLQDFVLIVHHKHDLWSDFNARDESAQDELNVKKSNDLWRAKFWWFRGTRREKYKNLYIKIAASLGNEN